MHSSGVCTCAILVKICITFITWQLWDRIIQNLSILVGIDGVVKKNWAITRFCEVSHQMPIFWRYRELCVSVRIHQWPYSINLGIHIHQQMKPHFIQKINLKMIIDFYEKINSQLQNFKYSGSSTDFNVWHVVKPRIHERTEWFVNHSRTKCPYVWMGLRTCAAPSANRSYAVHREPKFVGFLRKYKENWMCWVVLCSPQVHWKLINCPHANGAAHKRRVCIQSFTLYGYACKCITCTVVVCDVTTSCFSPRLETKVLQPRR